MNSAAEFQRLLAGVRELEVTNFTPRAALATIVRTRGSTFRRAGASMLVHADERVVCALAGGCPENDIIARARKVIAGGAAEIARYNDESAGDVLFEAGCGGELDVLIEPLAQAADTQFLGVLAQLHARRCTGFMATAYARAGKPLPRPQRLIWDGAVAWSDIADSALAEAVLAIGRQGMSARAFTQRLDSMSAACEVLIESLRPVPALAIIGANPAAIAVARSACGLGWKTMLVDAHEPAGSLLPETAYFIKATPGTCAKVPLDAHTCALVATFNVERDCAWLQALAPMPLAYLGAIGSRERAARMHAAVTAAGVRLHAPAGLDIGSETPEEIALAVTAEILAVLNARDGRSLVGTATPIHP